MRSSTLAAKFENEMVDACGARGKASMPTRLYRFHCTDGHDLVVDLRGRRLPTVALVRLHAEKVANELMQSSGQHDWSAWQVDVYDATGRPLMSKPFADIRYWSKSDA